MTQDWSPKSASRDESRLRAIDARQRAEDDAVQKRVNDYESGQANFDAAKNIEQAAAKMVSTGRLLFVGAMSAVAAIFLLFVVVALTAGPSASDVLRKKSVTDIGEHLYKRGDREAAQALWNQQLEEPEGMLEARRLLDMHKEAK